MTAVTADEVRGATGEDSPGPLLVLIKDRRLAFLVVGGVNTLIGTLWFIALRLLLPAGLWDVVVLALAHVASVPTAFVFYRRLVFRVRGHVLRDLGRFELVNLGAFGANLVLLPLLRWLTPLPSIPAQLLATAVIAVVSYVGHGWFSFRRPARERA